MKCVNSLCPGEMEEEIYYPLTKQKLYRCKQCGRTERVEDIGEPASYNDAKSYLNQQGGIDETGGSLLD